MIIETSSNQLFRVKDIVGIEHAWEGVEVKRVRGGFESKKNAKPILVRKAATKIICAEA